MTTKGLTNYYRIKRAVYKQQVYLFLAAALLVVSHFAALFIGYTWGWDRNEMYQQKAFEQSLKEAVDYGYTFTLKDIDGIKFYPRKDGNINIQRCGQQAAAKEIN